MTPEIPAVPTGSEDRYYVRLSEKANTGYADIRGRTLGASWLTSQQLSQYFPILQQELSVAPFGVAFDGPFIKGWVRIVKLPGYLTVVK